MATFDPYRTWLGIPPKEQPPNYYRLLGIGLFESDADVIANAADRQMRHVRTFQSGKKSAISQRILNELSSARITLLNEQERTVYDEGLQRELAAKAAASAPPAGPPTPPPPRTPGSPPPVAPPVPTPTPVQPTAILPTAVQPTAPSTPAAPSEPATPQLGPNTNGGTVRTAAATAYSARRRKKSAAPMVLLIGGAALALIIIAVLVSSIGSNDPPLVDNGGGTTGDNDNGTGRGQNGLRRPTRGPNGGNSGGTGNGTIELPIPGVHSSLGGTDPNDGTAGGVIEIPGIDDGTDFGNTVHVDFGNQVGNIREMSGHSGASTSAVFTNNGEFILSGGDDRSVRFWDSANGTERRFDGATEPIRQVALSPDMNHIFAVSGSSNSASGKAIIWDVGTQEILGEIDPGTGAAVTCGGYSPDGESIYLGCADGTIRVYDAETRTENRQWSAHRGPIYRINLTEDGGTLISGGQDGQVCISDTAAGSVLSKLTGHAGAVRSVDISGQGGYGLSAGDDYTVRYWDLSSKQLRKAFRGHTALVTDVAYSPNQQFAVSSDISGKIKIWDLAAGREIYEIDNEGVGVRSVAFSYNGRLLTTTSADGMVRLWGLPDFRSAAFRQSQGLDPVANPSDVDDPIFGDDPVQDPNTMGGNGGSLRQPIPTAETIRQVAAKLRGNSPFQDDLQPGIAPTSSLIARLLRAGSQRQTDPVYNYVLLEYAHLKAVELGDWASATLALAELETRFVGDPLPKRIAMIQSAGDVVLSTEQRRQFVPVVIDTIGLAIQEDRFDDATMMMAIVKPWVSTLRDREITETVKDYESRIASLSATHTMVEPFFAKLEQDPSDPQANLVVGKYYCRIKNDWDRGLAYLAKSNDPQYGNLALADLSNPAAADEAAKLADRWWQLAETLSGDEQANVRSRAVRWYRQAEPDLIGVELDKAKQRIAEVRSPSTPSISPVGSSIQLPKMSGLSCRANSNRQMLLDYYGGSEETEQAVKDALTWIVAQQKPTGEWNFALQNGCPDSGTLVAPVAATSLALMPLLGAGHDLRSGAYRSNVQKAIMYLRSKMIPASSTAACFVDQPASRVLPTHALATIAMCEVCDAAKDRTTVSYARMAVNYIQLSQNTDGGWAMDVSPAGNKNKRQPSTIEATVWFATALRTARFTGVPVDPSTILRAENYLKAEMKIAQRSAASPKIFDALLLLGIDSDDPSMQTYIKTLASGRPSGTGNYEDDYHNTQLMRQLGGQAWSAWNDAIVKDLLTTQSDAGDTADGTWFTARAGLNSKGGRLLTTVLAALTLETYYRHPPIK